MDVLYRVEVPYDMDTEYSRCAVVDGQRHTTGEVVLQGLIIVTLKGTKGTLMSEVAPEAVAKQFTKVCFAGACLDGREGEIRDGTDLGVASTYH